MLKSARHSSSSKNYLVQFNNPRGGNNDNSMGTENFQEIHSPPDESNISTREGKTQTPNFAHRLWNWKGIIGEVPYLLEALLSLPSPSLRLDSLFLPQREPLFSACRRKWKTEQQRTSPQITDLSEWEWDLFSSWPQNKNKAWRAWGVSKPQKSGNRELERV